MQRWTKKTKEGCNAGSSLYKKRSGRLHIYLLQENHKDSPMSSEQRAITYCKGTQGSESTTSPKVSIRGVQQCLCDFVHHTSRRKPQLTNHQRKTRIIFQGNILLWIWRSRNLSCGGMRQLSVTGNRGGKVQLQQGSNPLPPRHIEATVEHPDYIIV